MKTHDKIDRGREGGRAKTFAFVQCEALLATTLEQIQLTSVPRDRCVFKSKVLLFRFHSNGCALPWLCVALFYLC